MLFLGISGLMMVGVMVGAGTAININRYKDANIALTNYLQSQYDKTINVQNDRDNTFACVGGAISQVSSGMSAQPRGASPCTVIGRYIALSNDGTSLTSRPVYAGADGALATDDITALKNSNLFLSDVVSPPEPYTLEWNTRLVAPKTETALTNLRILIVRSPSSGTIKTFIGDNLADPAAFLTDAARQETLLCVDQTGLALIPRMGSVIVKDAANTSGVRAAAEGVC